MQLQKLTNPTALPVTLNSVKDHLRIERTETAFDDDLNELILAASQWVESRCHITLINTQYRATWETFPSCPCIKIPGWPVVSVDELVYDDVGGDETAIASYQTDLVQIPARLCLAIGTTAWPVTEVDNIGAVRLKFTSGYGTDAANQPMMAKHLIRLVVGHWFKNREAVLTGTISKEIELAAEELVNVLRVNEFEEFLVQ